MSVDVLGPASLNATTTRPPDARSFGIGGDTYFKDCTTPSSQDGTDVLAGWLNSVTGQFRALIRACGLKRNGIDPVVAYDQGDDMALRALQQMIQRGQLNTGLDTGSVNNVVVNLPVTPAEMIGGLEVGFLAAFAPTGPTGLTVSGFPTAPIVRKGAAALVGGEWAAGDWVRCRYVLATGSFQITAMTPSDTLQVVQTQFLISTTVTKLVGAGAGTDFANLGAAFTWLSKFLITPQGSVVFQLTAGKHVYTAQASLNHPNMDRVLILGAPLLGPAPTQATFPVTGNRVVDANNALTQLRSIYATEIFFQGSGGTGISSASRISLQRVLVTGDGTGSANGGGLYLGAGANLSQVSVHGFLGGGIVLLAGTITVNDVLTSSGNGGPGLGSQNGTGVQQGADIITAFNGGHGAQVFSGGNLSSPAGVGALYSFGNAGAGISGANGGSILLAAGGLLQFNGSHGASIADGCAFSGKTCTYRSNGGFGVYTDGGPVNVQGSAFYNNSFGAVLAANLVAVKATGASGVAGACSPAANTVGNNGALIII